MKSGHATRPLKCGSAPGRILLLDSLISPQLRWIAVLFLGVLPAAAQNGVMAFTPGIISTVAGSSSAGYSGDGQAATAAKLNSPSGLALDGSGNLYIADYGNHVIRMVDSTGHISTIAGNHDLGAGYSGDGGAATSAQLNQPVGLAFDRTGNLYIADSGNQVVRKVDSSHNITTVAGQCAALPCLGGFAGDNGLATSAILNSPMGIAVDGAGNLYIADYGNHRIRKVDATSGNINTIAGDGTPSYSGDGGAGTPAQLNHPYGVGLDSRGNLYIADTDNDVIRRLDNSGNISTVAGNNAVTAGFSGDNGPATSAQLSGPVAVATDNAGDIYVADHYNNVLRKVDTSGVIRTVAGSYPLGSGFAGDSGPATAAQMDGPNSVVIDASGNLFIADYHNNVVRKVDVTASLLTFGALTVGQSGAAQKISISDVGSAPLNFTQAFGITGSFVLQPTGNDCTPGTALSSGASCFLGAAFAPAVAGNPLSGTLTVADDGVGAPHVVNLSGVGIQGPAITSAASAMFTVASPGTFSVTTDGSPTPTLSQTGALPANVTFTDNGNGTATLAGTPTANSGGTYTLSITAHNGTLPDATQSFVLTVNQPPLITSANTVSFQTGTAGSFTVTTSGFPSPGLTEAGPLPAGVTFTDNHDGTGTLAGTPTSGGTFNLTFSATNGTTPNASQSFTLKVAQKAAFTSAASTSLKVGSSGSFSVTTIGSPSPSIAEAGSLPSGVTFLDNGDGTAKLNGTPAANTGGTYPITFTAQNGTLPNAVQNFTLTVTQPPAITSLNNVSFTIGSAGLFTITSSGFPKPVFSESGSLPSGVTFTDNQDGTAKLAGTPSAGGVFNITISASNGVTPNASQAFTLTVSQSPAITTAATAAFKVGSSGSFTVTSTGAPTPTLSESGVLPAGVTFVSSSNGTAKLGGTPAPGSGGTYNFTITAQNGVLPNASQSFVLTVGQAPLFTSAAGVTAPKGAALSFTVTTSGFPVSAITRSGTLPAGVTFTDNHNGTGTFAGTPTANGVFISTLSASNGTTPNASQSFAITVSQAPTISSADNTAFKVGSAGSFTVNVTGTPTPVITASGALPLGVTFVASGTSAKLSGTPAAGTAGTYPLTITAQNGTLPNVAQTLTLTVNQVPAITTPASTIFHTKSAGSFTFAATGFPVPTFSKSGTIPSGVTFTDNHNGTATLAGTISSNGDSSLKITASNGISPSATQTFTLTASAGPAITSVANTAFKVGTSGTFTITTAGSPSPTITEAGTLPSGVSFVNNGNGTAKLSGTPAAGTGGTYNLTFTAQNGTTPNPTQTFALTVNQAPTITSSGSVTLQSGSAGTFTVTTTGSPFPSLSVSGNLPSGITFTDNKNGTATMAGTTTSTGNFPLTLTSTSAAGTTTQSFSLIVSAPLGFSSLNNASFTTSTTGTFNVTTTGSPVPSLSLTGTLPSGVTFTDNHNGTGTLAGKPASGGVFTVNLIATNSTGSASQSFTLTVTQSPSFSSSNTATFSVGSAGAFTVTAAGYPAPAITEAGALPSGVSFVDNHNGTATLAGTATSPGTFPLTLTATSTASTSTQSFSLVVSAPPGISSANTAAFATSTLGTFTVTTTGSPVPSLSLTGTLPAGVTFSDNHNGTGTLTGSAANGGIFAVNLIATNSTGSSSQSFTLTVTQPPSFSSLNNATFPVGVAGSFTVTATGYPTPSISENGTLPPGVSFVDNHNGSGTLFGIPTEASASSISFTATNSGGSVNQPFILTASAPVVPQAVTIGTSINGLPFTVDGVSYTTPQTFTWLPGSSHSINITVTVPILPSP